MSVLCCLIFSSILPRVKSRTELSLAFDKKSAIENTRSHGLQGDREKSCQIPTTAKTTGPIWLKFCTEHHLMCLFSAVYQFFEFPSRSHAMGSKPWHHLSGLGSQKLKKIFFFDFGYYFDGFS